MTNSDVIVQGVYFSLLHTVTEYHNNKLLKQPPSFTFENLMSSVISQVGKEAFPIAPLMVSLRVSMSHIPLKDPSSLLIVSTLKTRLVHEQCICYAHMYTFSDIHMQWNMDTLGDQNNSSDK